MIQALYEGGQCVGFTVAHGLRLAVTRHPCPRQAFSLAWTVLQAWERLPELPPKPVSQLPMNYGNGAL